MEGIKITAATSKWLDYLLTYGNEIIDSKNATRLLEFGISFFMVETCFDKIASEAENISSIDATSDPMGRLRYILHLV
jgi:hypothetical protein